MTTCAESEAAPSSKATQSANDRRRATRILWLFSFNREEDDDLSGFDDVVGTKWRNGVLFFEGGAFDLDPGLSGALNRKPARCGGAIDDDERFVVAGREC